MITLGTASGYVAHPEEYSLYGVYCSETYQLVGSVVMLEDQFDEWLDRKNWYTGDMDSDDVPASWNVNWLYPAHQTRRIIIERPGS